MRGNEEWEDRQRAEFLVLFLFVQTDGPPVRWNGTGRDWNGIDAKIRYTHKFGLVLLVCVATYRTLRAASTVA